LFFFIPNGLKQGDALKSLLFSIVLENTIKKFREIRVGLGLN